MKTYSALFEHRKVTLPAFVLLFCGFLQQSSFNQKDFEKLAPITGTWVTKRSRGDIYETWKRTSKKEFAGLSFTLAGVDTTPLEKVRLYITGSEIVYAPVAIGQNDDKEVLFRLKSIEGGRFVFENLQHDFPKRIVYDFKTNDSLYAHIEGEVNGQSRRVNYPYKRIQ
ncbi:hypothetical protein GCM10010967_17840 [Dyadobacter beijingensis]|uniref:DUF6265 domain-containing protein n=1 Tax=Dyadobacter beijingensis TaxID=365489 RepID=A0ABQ2HQ79_9BACT|nr:DUF6265 family protein [Dyadobacter beijingensis]GGM86084.1 hypothetical protein GCM10010967_17840 [Dyadobacter beijingensis]